MGRIWHKRAKSLVTVHNKPLTQYNRSKHGGTPSNVPETISSTTECEGIWSSKQTRVGLRTFVKLVTSRRPEALVTRKL